MLPNYIIDELLKQESEKRSSEEIFIEYQDISDLPYRRPDESEKAPKEERGIAIIDFTI